MSTRPFKLRAIITALAGITAASSFAVGPTSMLYMVEPMRWGPDGDPNRPSGLDMLQGTSFVSSTSNALSIYDGPIAVSGDVRTLGANQASYGSLFDLNGTLISPTAFPTPAGYYVNAGYSFSDGTSDGHYNYGIDMTGAVVRMDRDWTNPVSLFTIGANNYRGITMNVKDGSFWVCQGLNAGDTVEHFSHTGAFLSSFHTGHFLNTSIGSEGLALDPADGTLWMDWYPGHLSQFDQSGHLLQTVRFDWESWTQSEMLGMEFNLAPAAVPEPMTALAAGAFLSFLLRRRKNS